MELSINMQLTGQESHLCKPCRQVLWQPEQAFDTSKSRTISCKVRSLEDLFNGTRENCRLCKAFWENASLESLRRIFSIDKEKRRLLFDAVEFDSDLEM